MIKKRIFVIFLLSILFSLNCDNNSTSQNKPESPYEYLYLAGTSPKQSEGILTIDPIILPGSEAGKNHLGWPVASKLNDEIIISYHLSNYHWGDSDNRKINNLMVAEENFRNNEISDSLDLEANLSITEDDGNFRIGFGNAIGKYKNKIVLLNRKGTFEYENGTWEKINNVKINNAAPGMGLGPNLEEYNNELFGFGFRDEGKINYGNAAVGNSYSLVTDYNNDGLNDIIHFWNYKGKLAVTVIGCDGNGIYTQLCTNYSSEDGITTYLGGYDVDRSKFIPAKINNDDYMDIIHLWDNNGKLGVVSLISNGLKGFSIGWSNSGGNGVDLGGYDGDRSKFISAKLNNDDYTDIIHLWDNNGKLGMVEIVSNDSNGFKKGWSNSGGDGFDLGGYDDDRSKFISAKIDDDNYTDIIHLWDNNGKLGLVTLISNDGNGFIKGWSNSGGDAVDLGGYDDDRSHFISAKLNNDDYTDVTHLWNNNGKLGVVTLISNDGNGFIKGWSNSGGDAVDLGNYTERLPQFFSVNSNDDDYNDLLYLYATDENILSIHSYQNISSEAGHLIETWASVDNKPYNGVQNRMWIVRYNDNGDKQWTRNQIDLNYDMRPVEPSALIHGDKLIIIARNHYKPSSDGKTWNYIQLVADLPLDYNNPNFYIQKSTNITATNISTNDNFGPWSQDTVAICYNPISKRIEVVATNRNGGGQGKENEEKIGMSLNLWSIAPEDLESANWTFEGTLLQRSVTMAEKVYDGMHPGGSVLVDINTTDNYDYDMQYIYCYIGKGTAGEKAGIFKISRTLNMEDLRDQMNTSISE